MKAAQQAIHRQEKHSTPVNCLLQRAAVNEAPVREVPPIVHEVLRTPGQPLDAETRAFFEPRFGHDFSGVRVHTDAKAAESAEVMEADAYSMGQHTVFGKKRFAPSTMEGQALVAHELLHVLSSRDGLYRQATEVVPGRSEGTAFTSIPQGLKTEDRLFSNYELKMIEKVNDLKEIISYLGLMQSIIPMAETPRFKKARGKKRSFVREDTGHIINFEDNGTLGYYIPILGARRTLKTTVTYYDRRGVPIERFQPTREALIKGFEEEAVQAELLKSKLLLVPGHEQDAGAMNLGQMWTLTDWNNWVQTWDSDTGVGKELVAAFDEIWNELHDTDELGREIDRFQAKGDTEDSKKAFEEAKAEIKTAFDLMERRKKNKKGYRRPTKPEDIQRENAELVRDTVRALAGLTSTALCNVISYYLYGKAIGKISLPFNRYYVEELKKGNIGLGSKKTPLTIAGPFLGVGSPIWESQFGLTRVEGKQSEKKLWKKPIDEGEKAILDASGVRLAISFQRVKDSFQPDHFFLIVKDAEGVWRNMDHTHSNFEQRGGKTDFKRVYRLIYDKSAQELGRKRIREERQLLEELMRTKFPMGALI